MKITRKKGLAKIKIEHNKKLFWIIILLIIALIVLIWFILQNEEQVKCVPATCCHPDSCASIEQAPDCSRLMCTEECRPGTLDCGQGSCKFIDGKCEAIIK